MYLADYHLDIFNLLLLLINNKEYKQNENDKKSIDTENN